MGILTESIKTTSVFQFLVMTVKNLICRKAAVLVINTAKLNQSIVEHAHVHI